MKLTKLAITALEHISDIANGRDQLDGFPRSRDEKQRRLGEIKVYAADVLSILREPEALEDAVVLDGTGDALESRGYIHMTNGRDIGALLDMLCCDNLTTDPGAS